MATNDDLAKAVLRVAERLLKEAVSMEHERLRKALDDFAASRGFGPYQGVLPRGLRPDVIRFASEGRYLFLGDAKVAGNEPPTRIETLGRVGSYVELFSDLLASGETRGGMLAVATDDEKAAAGWVDALNEMGREHAIVGSGKTAPAFRVTPLDERTFVTWW